MVNPAYTAIIRQDGSWWIGWVEEVPGGNSQGTTRDELLANLREALTEALEMNRNDARKAAGESFEEVAIQPYPSKGDPSPNVRSSQQYHTHG